jgi:hypothetical protein
MGQARPCMLRHASIIRQDMSMLLWSYPFLGRWAKTPYFTVNVCGIVRLPVSSNHVNPSATKSNSMT